MSLVAYDASSDEESDNEDDNVSKAIIIEKPAIEKTTPQQNKVESNGHISDEDENYIPSTEDNDISSFSSLSKFLPKPKNETNLTDIFDITKPKFTALPTPKTTSNPVEIVEDDDEFLHKKPNAEMVEKPNKSIEIKKVPVKITIPTLENFKDVEKEMADKAKSKLAFDATKPRGSSGLLSMLPKAKTEQIFTKTSNSSASVNKSTLTTNNVKPAMPPFIPDTVKHRRPATNTEDIDGIKITKKKQPNQIRKVECNKTTDNNESDGEDVADFDSDDFFSFNTDHKLPEVSASEIDAMVANKAAKIVETTTKYLNATEIQESNKMNEPHGEEQELESSRKRYQQDQQLNDDALQVLVGSGTKRRRHQREDIKVIDINSEQILPNKEEWMRSALASSTTYQPTGVLVDEEPASGTRRKHQITYLAHKAKANEAELQAMWAANRQNRRATQSKYGF